MYVFGFYNFLHNLEYKVFLVENLQIGEHTIVYIYIYFSFFLDFNMPILNFSKMELSCSSGYICGFR
jgi:hypothetical protein